MSEDNKNTAYFPMYPVRLLPRYIAVRTGKLLTTCIISCNFKLTEIFYNEKGAAFDMPAVFFR